MTYVRTRGGNYLPSWAVVGPATLRFLVHFLQARDRGEPMPTLRELARWEGCTFQNADYAVTRLIHFGLLRRCVKHSGRVVVPAVRFIPADEIQ